MIIASKIALKTLSLATLIFANVANAKVTTKTVDYVGDKKDFQGLVSTPENIKSELPVIVLVHNWMGITDETKKQAERFAQLGYIVFSADVYGKGVRPKDASEAGKLAGSFKSDRALLRKNLGYALTEALKQSHVNKAKVATIGYCFGGTSALELGRSGANLKAIVSFHGGLDSPKPEDGKQIKAEILALHGADDPFVTAKDVEAFEAELKNNKVKYNLIKYPGAVHSFTEVGAGNDNKKGAAYNKEADEKSFAEAVQFLKARL